MSTTRKFSEEEMNLLRTNPNILAVSPCRLVYTLDFKQRAVQQSKEKGMSAIQIFTEAGLTLELLGKPRITAAMKMFNREARSPEGLREPCGKSREERMTAFAKEDLAKRHTKNAIRELQNKVIHLEQQVEFLKKTRLPPK